jgi:epoxyqueuosine reductase
LEARRLGFQLVGITTPDPPPHYTEFENWLAKGHHGTMDYLASERARQRRSDPRLILPECRSILVLGIRYSDPGAYPQPGSHQTGSLNPQGRTAAYAWGNDYHNILSARLQSLVEFIEKQAGCSVPNRWYTDTGPILERDLAQRAGLGWIGKNTCLIHPEKGSYFLLAEILLGLDLEPDPPFSFDHCGTCTRCIEACPTGCILPDRTLDANRCISYLTIELKGPIPIDLRPQMGDWIFGCDICQQVCPWNERFSSPEGDPDLAARPGRPQVDLQEEMSLSASEFNRKFRDSPVKRAKRRGYLRNIAVALGNNGAVSSVPVLSRALLEDEEPLVRAHASWALGQIGGKAARAALNEALSEEMEPQVLDEIKAALNK